MKSYLTLYISILILSSCSNKSETISDSQNLGEKVNITLFNFQKINKKQSNLDFQNTLKHDLSTKSNLFDYDFFYNGAGVGIVDVNNDGLKDVFFCGNQVDNKLFLNKGNLVFEDISEKANINQHKNWSNGVTFADVNNDGWMDIYVTQGGPYNLEERQNLLYINQKEILLQKKQ